MVVDWSLQEAIWDELEQLRNADRVAVGNYEVETEAIENFYGRAMAREFAFESDEPAPWLVARTVGQDLWSTSWPGLHFGNK